MCDPEETCGVIREVTIAEKFSTLSIAKSNYCFQNFLDTDSLSNNKKSGEKLEKNSSKLFNETLPMIMKSKKLRSKKRKLPSITADHLYKKLNNLVYSVHRNAASVENNSICKMLASVCFAQGKELEGICSLVSCHATSLRQQTMYRSCKKQIRNEALKEPIINGINNENLDVENSKPWDSQKLLSVLQELPSEWHVVQVTAGYEHLKEVRQRLQAEEWMYDLKPVHSLHITVLPTGQNSINPICISLPKPNSDSSYDIRREVETLLNRNKADLTTVFTHNYRYWNMRKTQNEIMRKAILELEMSWLREWRILLLGDYLENLDIVEDIHKMVEKLVSDDRTVTVNGRTMWLLKKIATGACFLESYEVERAVKFVLPDNKKLVKNLVLSIMAKSKQISVLKTAKRKVHILILDECLDHFSFESMKILEGQPVTRFPSIHIASALYKEHKNSMLRGYKVINLSKYLGSFIVNPSEDLPKMERRMKAFINYWLPEWKGTFGKIDEKNFQNVLTKCDILMYNGHGSGMQFLRGEVIEKLRVLATVLLFGCSSLKLSPVGGRFPGYGISNQYLIANSPCMLGMLWEVTDGDVDLMTAEFISKWIPSSVDKVWHSVDEKVWAQGKLDFLQGNPQKESKSENETDLLIAIAKSKQVCKQYMTGASVVVRGLPIKLINDF